MSGPCWDAGEALRVASSNTAAVAALRAAENREIEIVLSAFGDESCDEQKARVFAVSGVLGCRADWDAVKTAWVETTEGKVFHAAQCESSSGDYAGIDPKKNLKLYADLTKLIARSKLVGHCAVLSLEDYRAAFPSDLSDAPYYWCFSDVVRALGEVAYLSVPREPIEFTFDQNPEREYNAALLYDYAANLSESPLREVFADKVSFATRRTVGIQVADLIAGEAMKNLDNRIGPIRRPVRLSKKTLYATRRFTFVYFRRTGFENLKQRFARMSVRGATLMEYRQWLSTKRLKDSITNRSRYTGRSPNGTIV